MAHKSGNPPWQDFPSLATPVTAAALENIERAINEGVGEQGPQGEPGSPGPQGLPGVNAVPADQAVATYIESGTETPAALRTAIDGLIQYKRYPEPVNITALAPVREKLLMARRESVVVTCVTDSIGWGVGVDGLPGQSTSALSPQQDIYRENAWPYQMATLLNRPYGTDPVNGWLGPGYSNVPSSWAAATDAVTSTYTLASGPFGGQAGVNRGGARIGYNGYVEWDTSTLSRPFTTLDVFCFDGPEFVDAAWPAVYIDGVKVHDGEAATSGVEHHLGKITIDGLDPELHTVRLVNETTKKNIYGAFIVPRNEIGVVVNRIGSPGATTVDAVGDTGAGGGRPRVIPSTVLPGYSDLVIIALSTNDNLQQVPLATFKDNVQRLIDAAACPVLLLDGPPTNSDLLPIKLAEYTQQLIDLSMENSAVAFAPVSALFGDRTESVSRGWFASSGTVHPSWTGAGLMGDYVSWVLQRSFVA